MAKTCASAIASGLIAACSATPALSALLPAVNVVLITLVRGILALYLTGAAFDVSAVIGFVALFGIAAMDGIIVLTFANAAIESGPDRSAAILRTCRVQMRPVTCVIACVGVLPAALSIVIGSPFAGVGDGGWHHPGACPDPARVEPTERQP